MKPAPERFREVTHINHAALACEPGEPRARVLREACAGDDELRGVGGDFLERPALNVAAQLIPAATGSTEMRLTPGTKLGPYET
jgi:hypothetical protein